MNKDIWIQKEIRKQATGKSFALWYMIIVAVFFLTAAAMT